jgi:hypothetical protein
MKIYQAINLVQSDLAKHGIAKDRTNQQGNSYKFRGIDDVYNAISPLLAKHGLCILPRMISRQCLERQTAKGSAIFYVTVEAEFDFVSAEDGSKHTVRTFGEAMDMSDKATNKAMSAAYKYAAFQAFAIPTEGDNDTESQTLEIISALPESVVADYSIAMKDCVAFESLKESFANAYAAAKAANDGDAAATFKKIYDAKKAEMLGGQA